MPVVVAVVVVSVVVVVVVVASVVAEMGSVVVAVASVVVPEVSLVARSASPAVTGSRGGVYRFLCVPLILLLQLTGSGWSVARGGGW